MINPTASQLHTAVSKFNAMYDNASIKSKNPDQLQTISNYGNLILKHLDSQEVKDKLHAIRSFLVYNHGII